MKYIPFAKDDFNFYLGDLCQFSITYYAVFTPLYVRGGVLLKTSNLP